MPALQFLGRRWRLSGDDFFFMGMAVGGIHIAWLVLVTMTYIRNRDRLRGCEEHGELLLVYTFGCIPLFSLCLIFDVWIAIESLKGTMLEPSRRRHMPTLLTLRGLLLVVDFCFSGYGVYVYTVSSKCLESDKWSLEHPPILLMVVGNCTVLVLTLLTSSWLYSFNAPGDPELYWEKRCDWCSWMIGYPRRSREEGGEAYKDTSTVFHDIAQTFATFLKHLDLTPSDTTAALALMSISHHHRATEEGFRSPAAKQSYEPPSPELAPLQPRSCPESPSPVANLDETLSFHDATDSSFLEDSERGEPAGGARGGHEGAPPREEARPEQVALVDLEDAEEGSPGAEGGPPAGPAGAAGPRAGPPGGVRFGDLDPAEPARRGADLREAEHFIKYAVAAYGWLLFLKMNLCTGCCKLCFGRGCIMCCPEKRRRERASSAVQLGSLLSMDRTALLQNSQLAARDLVFVNEEDHAAGLLPFFVALDRSTRSVVVAIRGTLSLTDGITDLLFKPEALPPDVPPGCNGNAHSGILSAASAIHRVLQRRQILQRLLGGAAPASQSMDRSTGSPSAAGSPTAAQASAHGLPDCTGWNLVVTGHSLGAGTASLLSILLKNAFPRLRCWAFSPPGGLLSRAAAQASQRFIRSIVVGDDVVPRLSFHNLVQMRNEMMEHAARCKVSKARLMTRIFLSGLTCGCAPIQPHQVLHESVSECSPEARDLLTSFLLNSAEHDLDPEPMYPPGKMTFLCRTSKEPWSEVEEDLEAAPAHKYRVRTVQGTEDALLQIVVSLRMLLDHLPDKVQSVIRHVNKTQNAMSRNDQQ